MALRQSARVKTKITKKNSDQAPETPWTDVSPSFSTGVSSVMDGAYLEGHHTEPIDISLHGQDGNEVAAIMLCLTQFYE
jgi:hypothetical protein